MFTNVLFYVGCVVLVSTPLIVALTASITIRGKIIACLGILVVAFMIMCIMYKYSEKANDRWNNGFCECGGAYELSAASQHGAIKSFYYTCDHCGHTEEFSHLMK